MKNTITEYGRYILVVIVGLVAIGLILGGIWGDEIGDTIDKIFPDNGPSNLYEREPPTLNAQNQVTRVGKEMNVRALISAYNADGTDISEKIVISGETEFFNSETGIFCASVPGKYTLRLSVEDIFTTPEGEEVITKATKKMIITVDNTLNQFAITIVSAPHGKLTTSVSLAKPGANITLKPVPDSGYYFAGATYKYDGKEETIPEGQLYFTMPGDDVEITPIWKPLKLSVLFDANEGSFTNDAKESISVLFGEKYSFNPDTSEFDNFPDGSKVSRPGYKFMGWYTSKRKGELITADTIVSTPEIHTLYAHWETAKYTITLDYGDGKKEPLIVEYGKPIGTLPIPEKNGFAFEAWTVVDASTGEPTKLSASTKYTWTTDIIAKAQYRPSTVVVSFDANGGSVPIKSQSVQFDSPYGNLPIPSYPGFEFLGWFTKLEGGEKIVNESIVSIAEKHTLYAHWGEKTYVASFHANGGTFENGLASLDITGVKYGSGIKLPAAPKPPKDGVKFLGWYTAVIGGVKLEVNDNDEYIFDYSYDKTFYARWDSVTVTVKFDPNGGTTPISSIKAALFSPYGELPVPTRIDHAFLGWFTEKEGGTEIKADTIVATAENHTLYAHWQEIKGCIIYVDDLTTARDFADESDTDNVVLPADTPDASGRYRLFDSSAVLGNPTSGSVMYSEKASHIVGVEFGPTCNRIEANAFTNCRIKGILDIPTYITDVGSNAFANTLIGSGASGASATEYDLTLHGDTVFGKSVFSNCDNLVNVKIEEGVTEISDGTFAMCQFLATPKADLVIPSSVKRIGRMAFMNDPDTLKANDKNYGIVFESGSQLEAIEDEAFMDVAYTGELPLSSLSNLKEIGDYAFSLDNFSGKLYFPESLTLIGDYAFSNAVGFTDVDFVMSDSAKPLNLQVIGEGAFYHCTGLTNIQAYYTDENNTLNAIQNDKLALPSVGAINDEESDEWKSFNGGVAKYDNKIIQKDEQFVSFAPSITDTVSRFVEDADGNAVIKSYAGIGKSAFEGCKNLTSVITLPRTVDYEKVESGTFKNCSNIQKVVIPDTVGEYDEEIFLGCSSLYIVTMPCNTKVVDKFDSAPFSKLSAMSDEEFDNLYRKAVLLGDPDAIKTLRDAMLKTPEGEDVKLENFTDESLQLLMEIAAEDDINILEECLKNAHIFSLEDLEKAALSVVNRLSAAEIQSILGQSGIDKYPIDVKHFSSIVVEESHLDTISDQNFRKLIDETLEYFGQSNVQGYDSLRRWQIEKSLEYDKLTSIFTSISTKRKAYQEMRSWDGWTNLFTPLTKYSYIIEIKYLDPKFIYSTPYYSSCVKLCLNDSLTDSLKGHKIPKTVLQSNAKIILSLLSANQLRELAEKYGLVHTTAPEVDIDVITDSIAEATGKKLGSYLTLWRDGSLKYKGMEYIDKGMFGGVKAGTNENLTTVLGESPIEGFADLRFVNDAPRITWLTLTPGGAARNPNVWSPFEAVQQGYNNISNMDVTRFILQNVDKLTEEEIIYSFNPGGSDSGSAAAYWAASNTSQDIKEAAKYVAEYRWDISAYLYALDMAAHTEPILLKDEQNDFAASISRYEAVGKYPEFVDVLKNLDKDYSDIDTDAFTEFMFDFIDNAASDRINILLLVGCVVCYGDTQDATFLALQLFADYFQEPEYDINNAEDVIHMMSLIDWELAPSELFDAFNKILLDSPESEAQRFVDAYQLPLHDEINFDTFTSWYASKDSTTVGRLPNFTEISYGAGKQCWAPTLVRATVYDGILGLDDYTFTGCKEFKYFTHPDRPKFNLSGLHATCPGCKEKFEYCKMYKAKDSAGKYWYFIDCPNCHHHFGEIQEGSVQYSALKVSLTKFHTMDGTNFKTRDFGIDVSDRTYTKTNYYPSYQKPASFVTTDDGNLEETTIWLPACFHYTDTSHIDTSPTTYDKDFVLRFYEVLSDNFKYEVFRNNIASFSDEERKQMFKDGIAENPEYMITPPFSSYFDPAEYFITKEMIEDYALNYGVGQRYTHEQIFGEHLDSFADDATNLTAYELMNWFWYLFTQLPENRMRQVVYGELQDELGSLSVGTELADTMEKIFWENESLFETYMGGGSAADIPALEAKFKKSLFTPAFLELPRSNSLDQDVLSLLIRGMLIKTAKWSESEILIPASTAACMQMNDWYLSTGWAIFVPIPTDPYFKWADVGYGESDDYGPYGINYLFCHYAAAFDTDTISYFTGLLLDSLSPAELESCLTQVVWSLPYRKPDVKQIIIDSDETEFIYIEKLFKKEYENGFQKSSE